MTKLKGKGSLDIDNMPISEQSEKLGLIKESRYVTKSYRITKVAADTLEELTAKFTVEMGIDIAMSKVLELAIFYAEFTPIELLLKNKKNNS